MSLLRSLAFYTAFYGGSVAFVMLAVGALALAPGRLPGVVRNWSRWHRFCLRYLAGIRVRETGERATGPVLYAFRHESFFEAIDLPALLDWPAVFAKIELFSIPGWGRAARAYGAVPVARTEGAKTLRAMVREARAFAAMGRPLVIFPEGTRVPHGTRMPLQAGFAGLYKLLGLPVVPVAVDSGVLYHHWIKRPGTITLQFGTPIEPGLPRAEIEARVTAAINALNPA
jgi:1-acyl-sn-glycerol-3-phosphate acyltransferase